MPDAIEAVTQRVLDLRTVEGTFARLQFPLQPLGVERLLERLLGIRLGAEQTARGKAFAQGVVDRAGENGLAPLFSDPAAMPTPNEIEAPGLWLARVTDT